MKADEGKREAFVAEYAALREECQETGVRIFFADEAYFRADAELRGKWVLKGKPPLVDSTSPRYGEKASYYSVVCLETGDMDGAGRQHERENIGSLLEATEGEGPWAAEGHLGQHASPSWGSDEKIPADTRPGSVIGESARVQSGLQRR